MADFDTLFTEKECSSLLNKCMLRYDPGHFSFKPRLMFEKDLSNLQPAKTNFATEGQLLDVLNDHFAIGDVEDICFKGVYPDEKYNSSKIKQGNVEHCTLIHRNNYYVDLKRLVYDLGRPGISTASSLKTSRLYEAIVTFMIAASHYNSLVPHLKWLCSSFIDDPYYDVVELTKLQTVLNSKTSLKGTNIFLFLTNMSNTLMFSNDTKTASDIKITNEVMLQNYHELLVFGTEVICRIETIPDNNLKRILYNSFDTSKRENKITQLLYVKSVSGDIVPTKEVLEIANIKDMEQRYYAIRNFVKAHKTDIEDAIKSSDFVNPMFCEFVKYCQNESSMNIRIKTIFMLEVMTMCV